MLIVDGRRRRSSEQGRLLSGELLVGEHAALVQLAELLQLLDRLARGARSGGSSKTSDRLHLSDLVKHPVPAGSSEEMYEYRAEALQGRTRTTVLIIVAPRLVRPVDNQRPTLDVVAR